MNIDQVILDTLDGSGFEQLCANIYRRLGYDVENVRYTGDEGRDLILTGPTGETIVAECKHWPKSSIGRPVVQKLHSAMLTYPAEKGMLLTTGTFSLQARAYAEPLPIQLVDGSNLKDMAARIGINLVGSHSPMPVMTFFIAGVAEIRTHFNRDLFNRLLSAPAAPDVLFSMLDHSVIHRPSYHVRYSLHQDFSTGVGLIHQIHVDDGYLLLDGKSGSPLPSDMASFMQVAPMIPFTSVKPAAKIVQSGLFSSGLAEVTGQTKEHISHAHRVLVHYTGSNNRHYQKDCKPNKQNITLKSVQQVYLPEHSLELRALKHRYQLKFLENSLGIFWLERRGGLFTCTICGGHVEQPLLCNSCGSTAHRPSFFFPHSFQCKVCYKTICRNCAYRIPRWRVFKSVVCYECADAHRVLLHTPIRKASG